VNFAHRQIIENVKSATSNAGTRASCACGAGCRSKGATCATPLRECRDLCRDLGLITRLVTRLASGNDCTIPADSTYREALVVVIRSRSAERSRAVYFLLCVCLELGQAICSG